MQFLNKTTNIDFMSKRMIATILSALLIVISITSLVTQSLNFGIDFTGGTMIEVAYEEQADLTQIRSKLEQSGYGDAIVQNFGSIHDVLIRLPILEAANMAELSNEVVASLQEGHPTTIDVRRVEFWLCCGSDS